MPTKTDVFEDSQMDRRGSGGERGESKDRYIVCCIVYAKARLRVAKTFVNEIIVMICVVFW